MIKWISIITLTKIFITKIFISIDSQVSKNDSTLYKVEKLNIVIEDNLANSDSIYITRPVAPSAALNEL